VIAHTSDCVREPVAVSMTSQRPRVLCAWSSSIAAKWMLSPSSESSSAASGVNLDAVSGTTIVCAPISTPKRVRYSSQRSAMVRASDQTIFAWSRVVAAL
jgi:hypothetical protein